LPNKKLHRERQMQKVLPSDVRGAVNYAKA